MQIVLACQPCIISHGAYIRNGHTIYRQDPTRADKNRQEPSRGILRLKYYLLDPIDALYIQN